jgi:4-amino-4-deoxy-L-arabinose transferase-like glycosyltransferase
MTGVIDPVPSRPRDVPPDPPAADRAGGGAAVLAPEAPPPVVVGADRQVPREDVPPSNGRPAGVRGVRRILRGREDDPAWARPALLALLAATAVLYLWDLGASGWANAFYSAAVQAGTKSWKAFFFGSSDASNFITVDKPPASLWVMELSARAFGLNAWSVLVPQALEGVATVGVVYATVHRWFSAKAALLSGAVMAATPVAVLMFRYNNPDALLVLLLALAAYATVRALERAQTWWLVAAMTFVGFGFITKMLQAFLVVPALVLVYLVAAPTGWWRRVGQLALSGVALVVSSFWWVAAVQLTPAADRPYIGGSQNNSLLGLIFGYNGFGRLTGNETGSVGGGLSGASMWGPTGWTRMFNSSFGGQISWLLPAAVILLAACLILTVRAARTDRTRAAFVLWGGWLIVTALVFSFAQGIIHPYYTVALAPAVAALVGMGASVLWRRRRQWFARVSLAVALAATGLWSYQLLDRSPTWLPWLRGAVLTLGIVGAAIVIVTPFARRRLATAVALVAGAVGLAVALGGPVAYALNTANTPHSGAIPSAGPPFAAGGPGAFGGFGGPFGGRGFGPGGRAAARRFSARFSAPGIPGGFPGHRVAGGGVPVGGFPGGGTFAGAPPGGSAPGAFAGGFGGGRGGGFANPGGFLSATSPSRVVDAALQHDASSYTWPAATVNSNSAAGYQLGSGEPVMAIGGFNGTDPAPTLAQFESDVAHHRIHYFIPSGGFGGRLGGGSSSGATAASQITSWVESHYSAHDVGGTTMYDLTPGTA